MFFKLRAQFASGPTASQTPRTVATSERIYAVGDIHGRCDLLELMLDTIGTDMAQCSDGRRARVIFLGDYVDRGDQSKAVLDVLSDEARLRASLKTNEQVQFDFLAGNHEVALLNFLDNPVENKAWLKWGGLQTLASFGLTPVAPQSEDALQVLRAALSDALKRHMAFLTRLKKMAVSGDVVFVHADLDPERPLEAQPDEAVFWGLTGLDDPQGVASQRMVHGHYAGEQPVSLPHRICVDTGAYYSGRLSAVRLDDEERFLTVRR